MGQNNDPTEHGDSEGHQGGQVKISEAERKRQSGYRKGSGSNDPQPQPNGKQEPEGEDE
jgi:hypothetical protein